MLIPALALLGLCFDLAGAFLLSIGIVGASQLFKGFVDSRVSMLENPRSIWVRASVFSRVTRLRDMFIELVLHAFILTFLAVATVHHLQAYALYIVPAAVVFLPVSLFRIPAILFSLPAIIIFSARQIETDRFWGTIGLLLLSLGFVLQAIVNILQFIQK